jgi:hypothetical protein
MFKLTKSMLVDAPILGFAMWFLGYLAGIALFFTVSQDFLGWILCAILTPVSIAVCYKRFGKRNAGAKYYAMVGAVWLAIAVAFDYVFLVAMFNSTNYYKLDVIVYYALAFLIPFLVGIRLKRQ